MADADRKEDGWGGGVGKGALVGFVSAECDRERREKPFPAIFSFALVVPPEKRPKSLEALQAGILVS